MRDFCTPADIEGMDDTFTDEEVEAALCDFIMKRHMLRLVNAGSLGEMSVRELRDAAPPGTGYAIVKMSRMSEKIDGVLRYISDTPEVSGRARKWIREYLGDS